MFYNNLGGSSGSFPGPTFTDGKGNSGSFVNVQSSHYWSGTQNPPLNDVAWYLHFATGSQNADVLYREFPTWAVRDGDVAAVPISGSIWLLGSGLAGLVGW